MEIKTNIRHLHLIRGFASFIVAFSHTMWPFWIGGTAFFSKPHSLTYKAGGILSYAFSNATAQVIVFFVLSGFMISYSYEKNKWKYKDFLINRLIRIYIPVLASLILGGLVILYISKTNADFFLQSNDDYNQTVGTVIEKGSTFNNLLTTLVFYRTKANYFGFNYVLWSLLYEMIFYLLFPIIKKNIKTIFIISVVLHPIHFFLDSSRQMPLFWAFFPTQFLFYFSSGVFLYTWLKNKGEIKISKRVLDVSLLGLFFGALIPIGYLTNRDTTSFIPATIFACIWIYRMLKYGAKDNLFSKSFMWLGKISFSLYLVHVPILLLLYSIANNLFGFTGDTYVSPWIHFGVTFLLLPPAYLFYKLVEVESIKLIEKHKLKIKNKKKSTSKIKVPPEIRAS
jgi:peptidoglycan/LPS O-acetylase OafA/YrhL